MKKFTCFTKNGLKPQMVMAPSLRKAKTIYRDLYAQFEKYKDIAGYAA